MCAQAQTCAHTSQYNLKIWFEMLLCAVKAQNLLLNFDPAGDSGSLGQSHSNKGVVVYKSPCCESTPNKRYSSE